MEPWIKNIYFAFSRRIYMSELIIIKFRTIAKPRATYKIEPRATYKIEWEKSDLIEWKKEIPEFIREINDSLG